EGMTQALLRMADAVTTPGIALAMYARSVRGGASSSQVYVVPNGISEHFLKQYDGRYVREKLGYSEGDLVVGYVGSIEFWLDMKPLIEAVSEARKQGCSIRFMLIGGHLQTAYAEKVARWIEQEGIGNITDRLGFIHHEEVPRYIASMDIGAIPFDVRNPTAYYAAPNKLWEYLSQGVSVVSTPIPEVLAYKELANIVRSKKDYVTSFMETAKRKERNEDNIKRKAKIYVEKRTWSNSAEKIKKIIQKILHKK
ncbi:MAG: glycosyltransferase, partial [Candidatus Bathyarchaeia archaeon]